MSHLTLSVPRWRVTNIYFLQQHLYIIKRKVCETLENDHQKENSLIFFQILSTFFKEMCGDKSGEFLCGYLGLKGLMLF